MRERESENQREREREREKECKSRDHKTLNFFSWQPLSAKLAWQAFRVNRGFPAQRIIPFLRPLFMMGELKRAKESGIRAEKGAVVIAPANITLQRKTLGSN